MFYQKFYETAISPLSVFYMRHIGPYGAENAALMHKFRDRMEGEGLCGASHVIWTVAWDDPKKTSPQDCRYDICVEQSAGITSGMPCQKLPGGRYAIFGIRHTREAVAQAWTLGFAELARRGLPLDESRPILERYASEQVAAGLCELCFPITKPAEDQESSSAPV